MTMLDATTAPLGADARAFVLLKSRRRLDLLNPDPQAWTDDDLAAGLSRTMRWARLPVGSSPVRRPAQPDRPRHPRGRRSADRSGGLARTVA